MLTRSIAGWPAALAFTLVAPTALGQTIEPRAVMLHVESQARVTVVRHDDSSTLDTGHEGALAEGTRFVCASPCDALVDVSGAIYTAGGAFPNVERLDLQGLGRRATLRVSPGNRGRWGAGIGLMTLGSVALAVSTGFAILRIGKGGEPNAFRGNEPRSTSSTIDPLAVAFLGSGAVTATGIALWLSGRTRFDLHPTTDTGAAQARWWRGEF